MMTKLTKDDDDDDIILTMRMMSGPRAS